MNEPAPEPGHGHGRVHVHELLTVHGPEVASSPRSRPALRAPEHGPTPGEMPPGRLRANFTPGMPKLLIATTVPVSFGFFVPFADHFRRIGWTVDALTGTLEGFRYGDRFDAAHTVAWSRDPRHAHQVLIAAPRVRAIVAKGRYDIVHVHTPVASFVTRFALRDRDRAHGPIVVYTAHGFHFHPRGSAAKNALFMTVEKLAARWTDWLVVMNREDEIAANALRLLPRSRIRRMPGIGVDLRHYAPESVDEAQVRAVREELAIGDAPFVLMVAELIPRKRPDDALRAFAEATQDPALSRTHLVLAGDGPLLERTARLARALGIDRRAHFLGLRPDVPVLMRAASALVLPSVQEGLPRCVLEAMSMGLPVVATRIRGTTELLEGGCGTLFEVGDTAALAAGLRRVLLDPAAAAEDARRARERCARYDDRTVIRLHEELYADALAERDALARAPRAGAGASEGA